MLLIHYLKNSLLIIIKEELIMDIGDRVQTINTLCPISGTVVEVYDNLIIISDDDAETDDDRLEFDVDDLETV